MEYTLSMTFLTSSGEKSTFNVPGVKTDITKEAINSLMDTIIAKDVFVTNSGNLVKKSGAQVTQRQVTKFDVA
ncbi:DUF2922 domain-containing protein [Clostridium saccharoperbutylacetonicum]|uniref:DUF2922 domain-containing protein n=1 Tax=Clostridium saccharoperbutylacetonicum TaxID=36745 RepID=UPI000983D4DE|nr:DUF2922 domain-containing protein [Clostridium saccharoperbutylacetonicum]AQR96132.1 hypothetical protein CLSAP_34510 [Clostridium saccharoperbutylacetonicum]NSB32002.1 hypothetical protein [Clostridium saccharoperbutylacetonicum]